MSSTLRFAAPIAVGAATSQLLFGGLGLSPLVSSEAGAPLSRTFQVATTVVLAFIMINVGREFVLEGTWRSQLKDYGIAMLAATLPWLLWAVALLAIGYPLPQWTDPNALADVLILGRVSSPTSAGVLMTMLIAAGLGGTWLYRKARTLAVFDDLDTILLMVPLSIFRIGFRWQLLAVVGEILVLGTLYVLFKRRLPLRTSWPWLALYALAITGVSEGVYLLSGRLDPSAPIHLEVLLPAFILGTLIAPKPHHAATQHNEERVLRWIGYAFMALVGLSMPAATVTDGGMTLTEMVGYSVGLLLLGNLGKMAPAFFYRAEATLRERLALAIGMWPRGEVGAGIIVIALAYHVRADLVTVASIALLLNLLTTPLVIQLVRALAAPTEAPSPSTALPELALVSPNDHSFPNLGLRHVSLPTNFLHRLLDDSAARTGESVRGSHPASHGVSDRRIPAFGRALAYHGKPAAVRGGKRSPQRWHSLVARRRTAPSPPSGATTGTGSRRHSARGPDSMVPAAVASQ